MAIIKLFMYVDDLATGPLEDMGLTLNNSDFSFNHQLSNYTTYNADGWSLDMLIDPDQSLELVFHHPFDFRKDEMTNTHLFNAHKKIRGKYNGPHLQQTDVLNLKVCKRLASHLMGQAY